MKVTRLIALAELAMLTVVIAVTVWTFCLLSVAYELHQARIEYSLASAERTRQIFQRFDALLWKADTALEIGGAFKLELGQLLTKVRTQVKQASDESSKDAKQSSKAATVAVTQALDKTTEAINAVAESTVPAKIAAAKPVVVNVPPPVVMAQTPDGQIEQVPTRPLPDLDLPPKRRPWWRRLVWPWGR